MLKLRMRKLEVEHGVFRTFNLAGEERSVSEYFFPNGSTTDLCMADEKSTLEVI